MKRPTLWLFLLCAGAVALPYLASSPPDLDEILENQQERVSSDPRNPAAWNDLGNLLVFENRLPEAEQAYRKALTLSPADTSIRFNLALLLQQNERAEEAESELRQILGLDPRHAWAHYQVGVLLAARNDRGEALDHYARALAYDPRLSFAEDNPHILDNPLFSEALLRSQKYMTPSAAQVPRKYSEPDRIFNLIVENEKAAEAAEKAASQDAENGAGGEDEENGRADAGQGGEAVRSRGTGGSQVHHDDGPDPGVRERLTQRLEERRTAEQRADEQRAGEQGAPLRTTTIGQVPQGESSSPNRRQVAEQDRAERQARDARNDPRSRTSSNGRTTSTGTRVAPPSRSLPRNQSGGTVAAPRTSNRGSSASNPSDSNPPASNGRVAPPRRGGGSRYIPGSSSTSRLELRLLPEETPTRYASLASDSGR